MQIPYYVKQRITKRLIDIFMVVFLVITLFPIFWMVFSSFKSNTEILLGKIPFGRAGTDAIYLDSKGNDLFILTSDGGINKFNLNNSILKSHASIKSMATNYYVDDKYIWASTSDKGLVRISLDNFSKRKYFSNRFKTLDVNKIVSTFMVHDSDRILVGYQQKGIEKLFEFDKKSMKFTKEIPIDNDLSPVESICAANAFGYLWIGTNKGLLKLDIADNKIIKTYDSSNIGLLSSQITQIIPYRQNLIFATLSGVYIFSPGSGNIIRKFDAENGVSSSRINTLRIYEDTLFAGTNNGLTIIDLTRGKIKNIEKIFKPIEGSTEKGLVTGDVFSLAKINGHLFVGSSQGRVSSMSVLNDMIDKVFGAKEGHLLVRWRNYVDLWKNINFALYLKNSFIICGITMILAMIFATLAAYALARFNFPGNKSFSIGVLATQMIPAIMYLIPIYVMFNKITMITGVPVKGTYLGIILVYSAFFIPFSIWILRGFFAAIPVELEEAARIDGCTQFQVFWHVVLPLAVPGIIATGIYVFLTAWDELMFAWILCGSDTMTIPVGIRLFVGNYQNRFDLMMAAATVATIPVMVLFFMLQRHIVKGLTAGAVKG